MDYDELTLTRGWRWPSGSVCRWMDLWNVGTWRFELHGGLYQEKKPCSKLYKINIYIYIYIYNHFTPKCLLALLITSVFTHLASPWAAAAAAANVCPLQKGDDVGERHKGDAK